MSPLLPGNSPQIQLINAWNRGFKEKSLDILAKHLHKDFRRYTYPKSICQTVQTKDEWLARFAGIINFASEFDQTVHSVIETPGKVVVHSTSEVKNTHGVNMIRESIHIVHIVTDDDGSLKIKQIDEFTDSKAHLEMVQAFAAITGNQQ